jgi:tetratricopeptide (TPR) repeat protein
MTPDRLAELEEERRFLLRSLADLERERDAGDVDDVDYEALRDGYTVRAAATLRAIDDGRAVLPNKPKPDWRRRVFSGVVIIALVSVVWWALAASSAERFAGQVGTGLDPRSDRQILVSQARSIQLERPGEAAGLYARALELNPLDVEALAYRGWTLALDARNQIDSSAAAEQLRTAIDSLLLAIETDPTYPDPQCFLGIVYASQLGQADLGLPFIDRCLESDPPTDVRGLVVNLRSEAVAALGGDTDTGG